MHAAWGFDGLAIGCRLLITRPPQFTTPEAKSSSKYADRVAAKHPAMLDRRFIHPGRGGKRTKPLDAKPR